MGKNPRRVSTTRAIKALHRAVENCIAQPHADFAGLALFESLEKRQMLSVTAPAIHRANVKLDSALLSLYQNYLHPDSSAAAADPNASLLRVTNGSIELQTFANPGDHDPLVAALKRLKATAITGKGREVDALVPIASMGKLANVSSLRFAEAGSFVVNSGAVTSQGDTADQAADARTSFGINGTGVKVGIISDSFNTSAAATDKYANDVATGDLPSNVQILNDGASTDTDEGRAMAQVIYDSAPGVTLAFTTAGSTVGTFAAAIRALQTAGCKVIVDDVTNVYEPMFQDGAVAQAVASVTASGVTYISAAGNSGLTSYSSSWRAGTTRTAGAISNASGATPFYGGTAFNFGSASAPNELDSFQLAAGQTIKMSVQWDAPYFSVSGGSGANNQVDAYILNAAGNQIVGGASNTTVGKDPTQAFVFTNTGTATATYNLMIVNENVGTTPTVVKFVDLNATAQNLAFSSTGSIFGHANAAGSETIGAANYSQSPAYGVNSPVTEVYSGTGGTQILFSSTGGRLTTPISRQEPALVAPDGVYTTFFGTRIGSNPYPTFSGTSAAAASAAGVAALIIQKSSVLTPAQVDTAMQNGAITIGSPRPNAQAGYGLLQATVSITTFVANILGTVFNDSNANSVIDSGESPAASQTVYIDTNRNGVLDPGEPIATSSGNGTYAFYNQSAGSVLVRVAPPAGFVATAPAGRTVTVVGASTPVTGVVLGLFPYIFTNTNSNVTYTLETDPVTPANFILHTVSSVVTAPRSLIPTLVLNLGGGNATLNINYSSGSPIPAGGVAFNGAVGTTGNKLVLNGTSSTDNFTIYGAATLYNSSNGVVTNVTSNNIQTEIINGVGGNDLFSVESAQPALLTNLSFNGGVGNDTLTIDDVLPNNGIGTNFNAGTNTADLNTLNVNVGKFSFVGNPASSSANLTVNVKNTPNDLNVSSGVIFTAGAAGSGINVRSLAALNITPGTFNIDPINPVAPPPEAIVSAPASSSDRAVLVLGSLSLVGATALDLDANDMVVTSGSLATVNALLTTGFNNGGWNASTGIISAAAANNTKHLTALGSIINNNNGGSPLYGSSSELGTFDGQSPAATSVLVKYTYYGDADLSGKVDASDYSRIDNGFITPGSTGWMNGDFNYDSVINGSDYTLIDNAFNTQGPPLT